MTHINLTVDHRYFNLGFTKTNVGILIDLSKYDYFVLKDDLKLIDASHLPALSIGSNNKINLSVNPKITMYRIPSQCGVNTFWLTDEEIPVEKLEFFKTNQTAYYGTHCALWKATNRPAIPEGANINEMYAAIHLFGPAIINKNKLENIKAKSELLYDVLVKADIVNRFNVAINGVNVSIRDDLGLLLSEEISRWIGGWSVNKTMSYLFLDGEDVICNDLNTLRKNPSLDVNKVPWVVCIHPEHGNVNITFNAKAFDSKLTLLKDLFPNFKPIELSKERLIDSLDKLAVAANYEQVVKEVGGELLGDVKSSYVILHDEKGEILEVGQVWVDKIDNTYINIAQHIFETESLDELRVETRALLQGRYRGFEY